MVWNYPSKGSHRCDKPSQKHQKQSGEEKLYFSLQTMMKGRQQELTQRPWTNDGYEIASCFLIHPRTTTGGTTFAGSHRKCLLSTDWNTGRFMLFHITWPPLGWIFSRCSLCTPRGRAVSGFGEPVCHLLPSLSPRIIETAYTSFLFVDWGHYTL